MSAVPPANSEALFLTSSGEQAFKSPGIVPREMFLYYTRRCTCFLGAWGCGSDIKQPGGASLSCRGRDKYILDFPRVPVFSWGGGEGRGGECEGGREGGTGTWRDRSGRRGQPESLTPPPRPNSENSTQVNLKTTNQSKKSLQLPSPD